MGNYTLVVFTNPVEGREDDYNEWYDNQHLGDVIAAAGGDAFEGYAAARCVASSARATPFRRR